MKIGQLKTQLFYLTLVAFCISLSIAQPMKDSTNVYNDDTPWYFQRKFIATTGIITHTFLATYTVYEWWWEGDYHTFRFENDGFWNNYSLGVDKFGHFYTSYFYYNALREIILWGGYSSSTANWWGAGISLFYGLSYEIGDGFSAYSFSLADFTANALGVGYGLLQHQIPFLSNFIFKWSYYPSGKIPFDRDYQLTDDYDGHIYWLSINVHNLLSETWQIYWPRFLNISLGYGGENISGHQPRFDNTHANNLQKPARKFVISLDYNLSSLSTTTDTWTALKHIFDLFHYPAPGVRFIQGKSPTFKPLLLN
jgi:hypothetical protein